MKKKALLILLIINISLHLYAERDPFLSPFQPKVKVKPKKNVAKKAGVEIVKASPLTPELTKSLKQINDLLLKEKNKEAKNSVNELFKKDPKIATIPAFNQIKDDLDNLIQLEKKLNGAVKNMKIKGKVILEGRPNILLVNDHPVKEKENLKQLLKLENDIFLESITNKSFTLKIKHIYKSYPYK